MKLSQLLESQLKEMTIDEMSKHKVDDRFSGMVQHWYEESVRDIKSFMAGEKPIASVTEGDYTVSVMKNHRKMIECKGFKPTTMGLWMGFWDPDLKPLSKKDYDKASQKEKMEFDAKVQATKYAPEQFFFLYAEHWYAKDYERWYWDEGGHHLDWTSKNDYWKKKLK